MKIRVLYIFVLYIYMCPNSWEIVNICIGFRCQIIICVGNCYIILNLTAFQWSYFFRCIISFCVNLLWKTPTIIVTLTLLLVWSVQFKTIQNVLTNSADCLFKDISCFNSSDYWLRSNVSTIFLIISSNQLYENSYIFVDLVPKVPIFLPKNSYICSYIFDETWLTAKQKAVTNLWLVIKRLIKDCGNTLYVDQNLVEINISFEQFY